LNTQKLLPQDKPDVEMAEESKDEVVTQEDLIQKYNDYLEQKQETFDLTG
jgi:hypothetical protein